MIGFDMPGVAIQGFTRKALQMAQADQARDRLAAHLAKTDCLVC